MSAPRLQQANALSGLVMSVSITLGAVFAGLLVAAVGPGWGIGIDGLTYLASAWFLLRLRPAAFLRSPGGGRPGCRARSRPGRRGGRDRGGDRGRRSGQSRLSP